EIRAIHAGGGFGSIIGRNSFQRPKEEALRMLGAVMDIYAAAPERDRTRVERRVGNAGCSTARLDHCRAVDRRTSGVSPRRFAPERRMGGYRLPIGGQRRVHKKERLRQPCPSQKAK